MVPETSTLTFLRWRSAAGRAICCSSECDDELPGSVHPAELAVGANLSQRSRDAPPRQRQPPPHPCPPLDLALLRQDLLPEPRPLGRDLLLEGVALGGHLPEVGLPFGDHAVERVAALPLDLLVAECSG